MIDINKAANQLADMALMHSYLDNVPPDKVSYELIALYENHKDEFSQCNQEAMRLIVLRAVEIIRK